LDPLKKSVRSSEWFDLAVDPGERSNAPPVESLRQSLEARTQDAALKSRSGAARRPVDLSADQKEKLHALGYIGR
jgi:hypothetical protein